MFRFQLLRKFRGQKVKLRFGEDIEPYEILLDKLAQKKEEELGLSRKRFEVLLPKNILYGLLVVFFLMFLILFSRTFQLQVIQGEDFSAKAEENKFIVQSIQAARGVIYDNDLNQLVFNLPSFDLVCQKIDLPSKDPERLKVFREISEITKIDIKELEEKIKGSGFAEVLISENLDHQTLIILESKNASGELSGFQIKRNWIRDYGEQGESFAHLIGYTGRITNEEMDSLDNYSITDRLGKSGLEKSYEEILRRNTGKFRIEKDARGNVISKEIFQLPESGESIVLYLDSELQKKIEEEVKVILQMAGAKKAAVVALDPKTGGVLALVSLPNFDNNLFSDGSDPESLGKLLTDPIEPLFNRAVSGQYATGSIIKPLIAAAALQEKIIDPDKEIDCQGGITVPHRYNPDIVYRFADWKTHGMTDIRKAIAESCNSYFYTIGGGYKNQEGLGPNIIKKYLEFFGWGDQTQIDLPGEADGLLPNPAWKEERKQEDWWDGDTYNLSIGQGDILATPLQVAASFVAIANGGTLFKPQVVQKTVDSKKNLLEEINPQVIRKNFIDSENLQVIREGMRGTVTSGTATLLNTLPVKAAAKTGTAQTPIPGHYHNWISVFAPYEDPEIVLTIVVENVREFQGLSIPIAKEILNWYFGER